MRERLPYVGEVIHLNTAAGSLPDRAVHDAMVGYLELEARIGSSEARGVVSEDISLLYSSLAKLVVMPEERISVGSSHTTIWQTAFQALELRTGDRILVGETEWGGNLSAIWQRCRATGAQLEIIPSDPSGAIEPRRLASMLDGRVRLVCLTLAPAVNGLVNPLERITETLSGHPAWLFVDAAQAFANIPTRFANSRVDLATVSARKYLRAPRGTAFGVYGQRFLNEVKPLGLDQFSGPWKGNGPDQISGARKYEFAETSIAVLLGLKAAIDVALKRDLVADMARIQDLAAYTRTQLDGVQGVTVLDPALMSSGIVTFTHNRIPPGDIQSILRARRINIGAPGEAYAPLWRQSGRPAMARISPHAFNTYEEINAAVAVITAL